MLLYVIDFRTDEVLGEIEPTDSSEILQALEDSDYITSADACTVGNQPDDEFSVEQDGHRILFLSLTDPDDTEDEDEDEDENEDEDEFEDVDD